MKWAEMTPEQRNVPVAEKVMGENPDVPCTGRFISADYVGSGRQICISCGAKYKYPGPMLHNPLPPPHYSESMDAAWLIVKHLDDSLEVNKAGKLHSLQFLSSIATSYDAYSDHYSSDEAIFSLSDLAALTPEKICIAALRAKGIEVEP